jgi:NAD(P)-dependent dehydrogenase (short-subunit alcohol dehydrogenase family)
MGAVLVTGASTGIGAACAVGLAQRGHRVFAGVRQTSAGEDLVKQAGSGLTPLVLDVTKSDDIARAAKAIEAAVGAEGLQGLVNNAGISVNGPLEYLPIDDLRRQFEVNVFGQIAVTQAVLPMLKRARGRIVNIGSTSGFLSGPMMGPYAGSKHAMEALNDALRFELRPFGIHVSILQPGNIKTPIWQKSLAASKPFLDSGPEAMRQEYAELIAAVQKYATTSEAQGSSTDVVLESVAHALTSPRPRTRYRMGKNSTVEKIISRLPNRWADWIILKSLGV